MSDKQNDKTKTCRNCGEKGSGKYCSNCGQNYSGIDKPLRDLLDELFDSLNLDRRIIKTFVPFIFKPGFITKEYLEGKRKTYVSPLRLYLLMSLVFFFLAQATSRRVIDNSDNMKFTASADSSDYKMVVDDSTALEIIRNDSIFFGERDTTGTAAGLRKEKRQERLQESLIKALTNKQLYISHFYKNISYLLFILMPVFALLLRLLYIRRKHLYIQHLVFSLNIHSFALLIFSLMVILNYLFPPVGDWYIITILILLVYLGAGMKRFYGQGRFKTIVKELILLSAYTTLLLLSLFAVLVLTIFSL